MNPPSPTDLYEGRKSVALSKGDNVLFQADPYIPMQYNNVGEHPPVLGHLSNKNGNAYDVTLADAEGNEIDSEKNIPVTAPFSPIKNSLINGENIQTLPKNWQIVLRVPDDNCFAWPERQLINFTIRKSQEFTEIPGDFFRPFYGHERATYFTAWVNGEPVAQHAFLFRNSVCYHDGLFIRKDMRKTGIYFPLVRETNYASAKVADLVWWEGRNAVPKDITKRHSFGVGRKIMGIRYKGFPISLEHFEEYQKKHNLSSRDFTVLVRDDMCNLDALSPSNASPLYQLLLCD